MMRVEWLQSAVDDLADIWVRAAGERRRDITIASESVDLDLALDPRNAGESRGGRQRVLFVGPLVVFFRMEADGRTVTVTGVRESRQRNP